MANAAKARVFMSGRSQHVTIPVEFRFSTNEVYISRDPSSGVLSLSENPLRPSMAAILKELDEAGAANLSLDRDDSPPPERDLF